MIVNVIPMHGIEGLPFGTLLEDAERFLHSLPDFSSAGEEGYRGFAQLRSGLAISVNVGSNRKVRGIEIYNPSESDTVAYEGLDLIRRGPSDIAQVLAERFTLHWSDDGGVLVIQELEMALLREVAEDDAVSRVEDQHFDGVMVALPGQLHYMVDY